MSLETLWFVIVAVLLTGYVVLDGFDLGTGVLYPLLPRGERERTDMRAAIGPVWDGNEVWLITGAGAVFAAFPLVYAMAFSGFYLAIMLVLFGLILRAVSLEMRHRDEGWKRVWDAFFFVGSLLPALLIGVALGNIIRGVPLNAEGDYTGTFFELLNPYSLLIGVTGLALFTTHGAAWLAAKTEGELHTRASRARDALHWVFLALAVAASVATFTTVSRASDKVFGSPLGWLALVVLLGAVVYTRLQMRKDATGLKVFLGSALTVVALAAVAAVGNYPEIVPARGSAPGTALTVTNAASGSTTLTAMLVITIIGFPLVLAYTVWVYRTFRGKVRVSPGEY